MKKLVLIFSVLFLSTTLTFGQTATLSVPDLGEQAPGSVFFPITLDATSGDIFGTFQFFFAYDPTVLQPVGDWAASPSATGIQYTNANFPFYEWLNNTHYVSGGGGESLECILTWLSFTGTVVPGAGEVIVIMEFDYMGGYTPFEWQYTSTDPVQGWPEKGMTGLWTFAGTPFTLTTIDGSVGTVPVPVTTWTGVTSDEWFDGSNWDTGSFPINTDDIVIPTGTPNDPVIRDYANVQGVVNDATITIDPAALGFNAAALIMNNGGQLENNGTIILMSVYDPGFPPILPSGTFLGQVVPDPVGGLAGTGTYEVQRYMNITDTGNPDYEGWHYLSSPVDGFDSDAVHNYFLNTWDETTGMFTHIESLEPCVPVTPPLTLNKMEGWSLKEDLAWACPGGTGNVIDMAGPAWTAPYETAVTNTATGSYQGFNLVGNPFLCGLDLLSVDWTTANANIDPTAYVYQEGIQNYITVSGTSPDPFVGNTIPSTLGFFIFANAAGNFTLDGSEQALTFGAINKSVETNSLILKASSSSSFDIMRIYFNEEATTGYDRLWDAYKLFSTAEGVPQIYTPGGEDMLATNALQATEMLPMNFSSVTSGNYTIEAIETGEFSHVVLEDLVTGIQTDLLAGPYTFEYTAGEAEARFIVHFTPLGVGDNFADMVNIWSSQDNIYVHTPDVTGDIVVFNMMGQEVVRTDIEPGTTVIPMNDVNTYYVVKVITSDNAVTGKVFIK